MKSGGDFEGLINNKKFQVFLFDCPACFPFSFARHCWFVINEKSKISRWEVCFMSNKAKSWGYLHKNNYSPFSGIEVFPYTKFSYWSAKLLGKCEGSLAKRMIKFIKNSKDNYPFLDDYHLLGPNSNSYTQWVLNHFSSPVFKLSWRAIGKGYKNLNKK